jgi:hypothetical protein
MIAQTYSSDFSKKTLVIGGFPIEGYKDGGEPKMPPDNEILEATMGPDGHTTTTKRPSLFTLTFGLQNGSPSVSVLSSLFSNNANAVPFSFFDGNEARAVAGVLQLKTARGFDASLSPMGYEYSFVASSVVGGV